MPPRLMPLGNPGAPWPDPGSGSRPGVGITLACTASLLWDCKRLSCRDAADTLIWEPYTRYPSLSESISSGKNKVCFVRLLFHMYVYRICIYIYINIIDIIQVFI